MLFLVVVTSTQHYWVISAERRWVERSIVQKNNKLTVARPKLLEVLSAIDKTVLEMISSGMSLPDVLTVLCRIIEERGTATAK
jgi:hypothetical protein